MATKTYPIGTKIRYIGYCRTCEDKEGTIIEVGVNHLYINLPKSKCYGMKSGRLVCNWDDIVPIIVKNQQLLFAFME